MYIGIHAYHVYIYIYIYKHAHIVINHGYDLLIDVDRNSHYINVFAELNL